MNITVITKKYKDLPLREREILRYAGCRTEEAGVMSLIQECLQEAKNNLVGQICYAELPLSVCGTVCDFESFSLQSEQLAKNLSGCTSVLLMAATAGVGIDRLIAKYGRIAPSKALMFQAIGAELVEAVGDTFGREFEAERVCRLRPRFSPGYGDLPLSLQNELLTLLDAPRRVGLTASDTHILIHRKSVTALLGVADHPVERTKRSCLSCPGQAGCPYRKAGGHCGIS